VRVGADIVHSSRGRGGDTSRAAVPVIGPIVFLTIIGGIASVEDLKKVG
jgi:hypothetical protein